MSHADLARHRAALEALHDETLAAPPTRIEPNRKDEVSVGVADEDEQALSEMLQALGSQRNKARAELLAQIARALRKIAETPDEFGLCEDCEEEIPDGRLDKVPYAAFCADCQQKRDPRRGTTRRSTTEFK